MVACSQCVLTVGSLTLVSLNNGCVSIERRRLESLRRHVSLKSISMLPTILNVQQQFLSLTVKESIVIKHARGFSIFRKRVQSPIASGQCDGLSSEETRIQHWDVKWIEDDNNGELNSNRILTSYNEHFLLVIKYVLKHLLTIINCWLISGAKDQQKLRPVNFC